MSGPFGNLESRTRTRMLWAAAAAYVLFWIFLIVQDSRISDSGGPGIVPFEVAGSSERAEEILAKWGSDGIDDARISLIVDYPFLVAYSILLAGLCAVAAERLARRGSALARAGGPIGWGAIGAGAFDAIENAALLVVLGGNTDFWPRFAQLAAIGKFTLTGIAIVYVLAGLLLGRRREAPASAPP